VDIERDEVGILGPRGSLPEAKEHDSPMVGVAIAAGMLAIFLKALECCEVLGEATTKSTCDL